MLKSRLRFLIHWANLPSIDKNTLLLHFQTRGIQRPYCIPEVYLNFSCITKNKVEHIKEMNPKFCNSKDFLDHLSSSGHTRPLRVTCVNSIHIFCPSGDFVLSIKESSGMMAKLQNVIRFPDTVSLNKMSSSQLLHTRHERLSQITFAPANPAAICVM